MRGFLVYVVLPNLAFFALGRFLFLLRPLVNLDYIALWVVSAGLSRGVTAALYGFLVLLDLAVSGESIYEFSTADVLLNVHYLPTLDPAHVWAIAGVVLLFLAVVVRFAGAAGPHTHERKLLGRAPMKALAALLGVALAAAGAGLDVWSHPFDETKTVRLAGSRALEIVESGMALTFGTEWTQRLYSEVDWRGRAVLHDLSATSATGALPYNVVLIVVESEGLLASSGDQALVLEPLIGTAIAKHYAVTRGSLAFSGPTVAGELRALCGIRATIATVESPEPIPECLPSQLRRRGYEALSFHGNTDELFERMRWYPRLGFGLSYFAEAIQLKAGRTLAECGVLIRGVCDSEVAGLVSKELKRPSQRPKFIYWLTLSSHLPVDAVLARDSQFDCQRTASLGDEPGPCGLARILHRLHQVIAAIALDPALPPTRFVIVGDHAPPFAELSERALFSSNRVPFVDLVPTVAP